MFNRVTFEREVEFSLATFKSAAMFDRTTFKQARQFGPILAHRRLLLNGATFEQLVQIQASAQALSCQRARFLAGVQFRLRWAGITLDDADPATTALLTGVPTFKVLPGDLDEDELLASWPDGPGGPPRPPGQPWVVSLRRADVAGLAIDNTDLQACRFADAHNLDQLRLEGSKAFAAAPGLKAVATGWAWPPVWWWTRRQTLGEEHAWRADHEHGIRKAGWHADHDETWPAITSRWVPNPPQPARDLGRLERHVARAVGDGRRWRRRLTLAWRIAVVRSGQERARRRHIARGKQQRAHEIATVYRALRKAREDTKDEPGAADFYYGEMEMRRHAAPRFSVERAILTIYWLLAGYALRAWRAAATALIAIMLFRCCCSRSDSTARFRAAGSARIRDPIRGHHSQPYRLVAS